VTIASQVACQLLFARAPEPLAASQQHSRTRAERAAQSGVPITGDHQLHGGGDAGLARECAEPGGEMLLGRGRATKLGRVRSDLYGNQLNTGV
jgi:hypothetical protein